MIIILNNQENLKSMNDIQWLKVKMIFIWVFNNSNNLNKITRLNAVEADESKLP